MSYFISNYIEFSIQQPRCMPGKQKYDTILVYLHNKELTLKFCLTIGNTLFKHSKYPGNKIGKVKFEKKILVVTMPLYGQPDG